MKHAISTCGSYQIQIGDVVTFLVSSEAHTSTLFIIKVKIFMFIEWSYVPP